MARCLIYTGLFGMTQTIVDEVVTENQGLNTALKRTLCFIALTANIYKSKLFLANFTSIYKQVSNNAIDKVNEIRSGSRSTDRQTSVSEKGRDRGHSAWDSEQGDLVLKMLTESNVIKATETRVEYMDAIEGSETESERWVIGEAEEHLEKATMGKMAKDSVKAFFSFVLLLIGIFIVAPLTAFVVCKFNLENFLIIPLLAGA